MGAESATFEIAFFFTWQNFLEIDRENVSLIIGSFILHRIPCCACMFNLSPVKRSLACYK